MLWNARMWYYIGLHLITGIRDNFFQNWYMSESYLHFEFIFFLEVLLPVLVSYIVRPPPKVFKVDHPFHFILKASNTLVFDGRVRSLWKANFLKRKVNKYSRFEKLKKLVWSSKFNNSLIWFLMVYVAC